MKQRNGFTIVELLIVIVVIAILAAITIVAFRGVQQSARLAKTKQDINTIHKAIKLAHEATGQSVVEMSGNGYGSGGSAAACSNVHPAGTDIANLNKATDGCWVSYNRILDVVSVASNTNIRGILDPWGRPYVIVEWERSNNCRTDEIGVLNYPYNGWGRLAGTTMMQVSRVHPGVGC